MHTSKCNHQAVTAAAPAAAAPTASTPTPTTISLPLDNTPTSFSALLLRDACTCPLCVHPSTNQRLFSTADIPSSITVRTATHNAVSNTYTLTWATDAPGYTPSHSTSIPVSALRELRDTGALPVSRLDPYGKNSSELWGKERLELRDFAYEEYMGDEAVLYDLMRQLNRWGVAFVTGCPGEETALRGIARRMGPIKDTFYGETWDVRTVPQAINAAYTSHDLGFHTDLLYFQHPPHIQLLHCIQSASTGGASVFADAYKAAIDLFHSDPDAFEILATVPVNYHYNHPDDNVYRTTKPVIDLHPLRINGVVYTSLAAYKRDWHAASLAAGGRGWTDEMLVSCMDKINWGPPFLAPFSQHETSTHALPRAQPDGTTLAALNGKVARWHDAARKFNGFLQRGEYLYERKMKPGECVLFDNTRTLHSRRAFEAQDVGRPRWLRGTYVDKDPYFSKMRVLEGKFGRKEVGR